VQNGGRIDWSDACVDLNQLTESVEKDTRDLNTDLDASLVAHVQQGSLDLSAHVPRDPVCGIPAIQRPLLNRKPPERCRAELAVPQ
jgi:hypothetical protein